MPEPQPGTDRPADGSTPATGRDRDPAVSDEPTPSPASPPAGAPTGPDGIPAPLLSETDGDPQPPATDDHAAADEGAAETADPVPPDMADGTAERTTNAEQAGATPPDGPAGSDEEAATAAKPASAPTAPVTPARGSATVPTPHRAPAPPAGRPDPTKVESRPDPTKVETRPEPPAPRWSGSAPVPPPLPRRRAWGESAEPTPVPPPQPADAPEHQVPVDPWEGVDTTGWDLHSADFPVLPPTLPYPAPPPTQPYPTPPVAPPPVTARPVSPPPAPVSPPRPAPVRPPKQRRRATPPPAAPPPGFQAPKGYVPVPVRRRRRWPWMLLLSVACCCGAPLWWAKPLTEQYPASAALPDEVAGLRLREDQRSQATAEELETEVRQAHLLAEDTFAGVYTTSDDKRVTVFGGTGFRLSPESDANAEIARLTDRYRLASAVPVDTGVRGRYERCAVGSADGDTVVVCTSVDHGSLATGVFTRLSVDDSGRLLDTLRRQIVTPDQSP